MNILMLITALALSSIAAFYSIAGLAAIFAAAVVPIIIMGSILEVSKLVVASWLYRNWEELPKLLKSYFLVAVVILMTLTSMGIFGFLSKAHLDQAVPTGDVQAKIELIDEKIKTEKEAINEARATLAQLDKQVNETINRTANATDTKAIDRSVQIRKQQSKERKQLFETIATAQKQVADLQYEKAPLSQQARKIEAEVGPIKYIAALIYGDNPDQNLLEKAVRWVIIMIVSVFDPLAVLMLVGYNWTIKRREPKYDLDDGPLTIQQIDTIKKHAKVDDVVQEKKLFKKDKKVAKKPEEPAAEWDPSLYKGLDQAWDDPELDKELQKLFEGPDVIATPPPPRPDPELGVKTIEQEIEELQKPLNSIDRLKTKYTP